MSFSFALTDFRPNSPFLQLPENFRKPLFFWCFQGVYKGNIGWKWVNIYLLLTFNKIVLGNFAKITLKHWEGVLYCRSQIYSFTKKHLWRCGFVKFLTDILKNTLGHKIHYPCEYANCNAAIFKVWHSEKRYFQKYSCLILTERCI